MVWESAFWVGEKRVESRIGGGSFRFGRGCAAADEEEGFIDENKLVEVVARARELPMELPMELRS